MAKSIDVRLDSLLILSESDNSNEIRRIFYINDFILCTLCKTLPAM